MKRYSLIGLALALAAAATIAIVKAAGASSPNELEAAKSALARFHSMGQAEKAGYIKLSECDQSPAGAMGYHYGNPRLMKDPGIDALQPEVLLYAPKPKGKGKLELVGVEYFKADADQLLTTDADRPTVFDVPLEGPMRGHTSEMPMHYDRHVWLYETNPRGMFTAWNPSVKCW